MTKTEKIQFIAEDLATSPDEIKLRKQDVENWSDNEVNEYIYINFQHNEEIENDGEN